jgi:hypothetical protein
MYYAAYEGQWKDCKPQREDGAVRSSKFGAKFGALVAGERVPRERDHVSSGDRATLKLIPTPKLRTRIRVHFQRQTQPLCILNNVLCSF